jgi:hypothetical protein
VRACILATALLGVACGGSPSKPAVTVTMIFIGGGSGTIVSNPPGISCTTGTCSGTFERGTTVVLTATPGDTHWVRWGGACSGTAGVCSLEVTGSHQVTGTFQGANYAFVTSTTYSADGVAPALADAACNARAAAASLPGNYVAWLSTTTTDARARLGSAQGWIRTDGLPFAASVSGLTDLNQVFYPLELDETGSRAVGGPAFTGTTADGRVFGGCTCTDWTTTSGNLLIGEPSGGPYLWTNGGVTTCALEGRLYCFGTDVSRPLSTTPASGRRAFVSSMVWGGGGNVAVLDAICASDASTAGLRGNFKAFVATNGHTATERFDLSKDPWVRVDGLMVVRRAVDLVNGRALVSIWVHADGSPVAAGIRVWTGAANICSAGTADNTCGNWNDNTAAGSGTVGDPYSTEYWFNTQQGTRPCGELHPFYCFEE